MSKVGEKMNYYIGSMAFTDNDICHYGVKGMKWGVRRYQNEDGTLTNAGKRRYGYNLDLNDKSRKNIAKIRTGEARRRLDVAKRNNPTNTTRIAELQGRLRSAKRNEKYAKRIDKGAKRAAKGETIGGNNLKGMMALGAAYIGSRALTSHLNTRISLLQRTGRYTPQHMRVANIINTYGSYALIGAAGVYYLKKASDSVNIRAYNNARYTGRDTIKSIGSTEYRDRVESSKRR